MGIKSLFLLFIIMTGGGVPPIAYAGLSFYDDFTGYASTLEMQEVWAGDCLLENYYKAINCQGISAGVRSDFGTTKKGVLEFQNRILSGDPNGIKYGTEIRDASGFVAGFFRHTQSGNNNVYFETSGDVPLLLGERSVGATLTFFIEFNTKDGKARGKIAGEDWTAWRDLNTGNGITSVKTSNDGGISILTNYIYFTDLPLPIISMGENTPIGSITASVGTLFTDFWEIIALYAGIPFAFYIINKTQGLILKRSEIKK